MIDIPRNWGTGYIPLIVFNSLAWGRKGEAVELLLGSEEEGGDPCAYTIVVYSHRSRPVSSQAECTSSAMLCGSLGPKGQADSCAANGSTLVRLQFTTALEGLSYGLFYIVFELRSNGTSTQPSIPSGHPVDGDSGEDLLLSNDCLQVTFTADGHLKQVSPWGHSTHTIICLPIQPAQR